MSSLVVLRPIYIYPFLSISVKKATDNSFKFYSHRNQCHCVRLLIVVSDILLGIYQIASEYLLINIKNFGLNYISSYTNIKCIIMCITQLLNNYVLVYEFGSYSQVVNICLLL